MHTKAVLAVVAILMSFTSEGCRRQTLEENLAESVDRPVTIDSTSFGGDTFSVVREVEPIPGTSLGRVLLQSQTRPEWFYVAIVAQGSPLNVGQKVKLAIVSYISDNVTQPLGDFLTVLPIDPDEGSANWRTKSSFGWRRASAPAEERPVK